MHEQPLVDHHVDVTLAQVSGQHSAVGVAPVDVLLDEPAVDKGAEFAAQLDELIGQRQHA
ncbi:hypothetical protein TK06_04160 [Pseudomonas fluorescens]|uniref:Uncharacterized protein n=1 Tax=Pseudomonas fluorescens TaxID=294 RepID=A0A159ZS45_PSEFL|nr:hypothetical protein TK06_04160 [Pseudomonas fluorescens]